jgi:hypothetical protein
MHPTIQYEIAKAQIADRHRQSGRQVTARAARAARRALTAHCPCPPVGLARRVFTPLHVRSRRLSACPPLAPCNACV